MEQIPRPGEFYRHFKNKLYQVLAVAEHTETGESLVIYQALYGDFRIYARPLSMFVSLVDRTKYPNAGQKYRFEPVEPGQMARENQRIESGERTGYDQVDDRVPSQEEEPKEMEDVTFLMDFLDAETPEEKLAVLKQKGSRATARQLDMICETLELAGGDREASLTAICQYLETRIKYDGRRLRR